MLRQHRYPPFENREGWGSLSYDGPSEKGWASQPKPGLSGSSRSDAAILLVSATSTHRLAYPVVVGKIWGQTGRTRCHNCGEEIQNGTRGLKAASGWVGATRPSKGRSSTGLSASLSHP